MSRNNNAPSFEHEVKVFRDGAFVVGLGSIVVGAVIQSPDLVFLGASTTLAGFGFEGIRRAVHQDEEHNS